MASTTATATDRATATATATDTATDLCTASEQDAGALTVDALVDATPASRDRFVDLLRALSILVVVLWHWVFSVTHWTSAGALTMPNPVGDVRLLWLATWLLQVMPLFFLVGGFSNLAAWDASRRRGGTAREFLRSRLQRLFRPVAVYLAVWAAVDATARALVSDYPGVLHWGRVVFVPLWFLAVYAGVVLLVPATAWLHRHDRVRTIVGLGVAIALADLGRFRFGVDALGYANAALVFVFAHQLGYFWRDGRLTASDADARSRRVALIVGGLSALVVLTNLGVYPRSMVAVRGEAVSNMFPTTACIAALAVLQLGVVLTLRPVAERWLARRSVWRVVVAANGVAMTVFTWHMTALVLAIGAFTALGGHLGDQATASWWVTRPLWVLGPGAILAGLVALFSRFERPARPR